MKWACLIMLVLDLFLVGVAGFRYLTVPEGDVQVLRAQAQERLAELKEELEHRAAEQEGGGDSAWMLDVYREDAEGYTPPAGAQQGTIGLRRTEAEFAVDQSAAMQMNVMPGVTKTRENLRRIEGTRRDTQAYGERAMD